MRDPLAWIPVRYKLPLTFAFLCLLAFGLGGYVVTTTARDSLRSQLQHRLNDRATSLNLVVDKSLELLGRRVEDFASDGFIRLQVEALTTGGDVEADEAREALVRHLLVNKLPLVEEFVDALVLDAGGVPVASAQARKASPPASFDRDTLWIGPLQGPGQGYPFPSFVLSTPLSSIQGGRRLGYLQIVVRADLWAQNLEETLALPEADGFSAWLSSPGGHALSLLPAEGAGGPSPQGGEGPDAIRYTSDIARSGWRLDLAVDRAFVSVPVDTLVARFLYTGVALIALTIGLLVFPQQFLLKPLSALQDSARRIAEGDFTARVESTSRDEVGDLAAAFNLMASAVDERTRKLERSAEVLERREADIRFERDRLNTVIRSMEDGLFILDAEGSITLSNAAARPVIEALTSADVDKKRILCSRRPGTAPVECLRCISDFGSEVQGCVVSTGSRVYEINGAAFSGQGQALGGRVYVSRDVTVRVRQAEQEAHQERLSVLGEIAAVMAHELNNPLAAISMFSQMLLGGLDEGSGLKSHAEVIHRNTESCKQTIRALLDMATTSTSEPAVFDIHQLAVDVAQLLEPVAHRVGVSVSVGSTARDSRAFGDERQLRHSVVNLVMNAIQASEDTPDAQVIVETEDRGDEVAIVVRDNGPGIRADSRDHIFEPFFTTKPPGVGTGLGLPTSRRIVEAQGGRLSLMETGPGGTCFEVVVPRHAHSASPVPTLAVTTAPGQEQVQS